MTSPVIPAEFEPDLRLRPLSLVDVGARHGIQPRWQACHPHLRVIAFECDAAEYERLLASQDGHAVVLNTALSNSQGEKEFYIAKRPGGSSFLRPNVPFLEQFPESDRFQTARLVRLKTDTLDHQLRVHRITDVDFIKLDTQGTELPILEGASGVLATEVLGLEIEVEFAPLYQGQPLFPEVDAFVRRFGFELFDLRRVYWQRTHGANFGGSRRGQLVWADALYLRSPKSMMHLLNSMPGDAEAGRRSKLFRGLSIALVYGYKDYVLALAQEAATHGILGPDELQGISRVVARRNRWTAWLPTFRGRGHLALWCYELSRLLAVSPGPITSDPCLGNEP